LEDPHGFLHQYRKGAVLDEVQRAPELLSYLQQMLDENEAKGQFILTGSNNLLLLEKITQSLSGRVTYFELLPFSIEELEPIAGALEEVDQLIFKGGYPPVQAEGIPPDDWFSSYVRTYVERDVRQIRNVENLLLFERFLSLCAGRVGQMINYSNLANETGLDVKTIQAWLGVLQASYIVFLLPPFYKNFNKRIVKSPKLYFYDTGLVSHLLRIQSADLLFQHPYKGALFENLIVSELMKNRFNKAQRSNLYYWRDSAGHEVDVIIDKGVEMMPVEIKSGRTINQKYFTELAFWEKLTHKSGGLIFYGGEEEQIRSAGIQVKSWRAIPRF